METLRFLLTSSFFPPYHVGGDAVHVKYLAEELVKRGHEVHVLHSLDAYYVKNRGRPEKKGVQGVYTYPIKTMLSLSAYEAYMLGFSSTVVRTFDRLIGYIRPDVVHHHNISLLGYVLLKKRGNYVNLYTAHDYWLICQNNNLLKYGSKICDEGSCFLCTLLRRRPPQLWRYSGKFKEIVENETDCLIAPSDYLRMKMLEKYKLRAVTIPNFVPEPPSNIELTKKYSSFFIYAGVLEIHKGVMVLLEVYKEIADKIDEKLFIVGEGSMKRKLARYINRHGLNSKVFLLGRVKRNTLLSLLKSAKALIIPSMWPENCPLIALEAISLGTPVIASNKGGLPEIVNKINKKLVYNSITELKQILLDLDKEKYDRDKLKKIYAKHYSPQIYLESYLKLVR